jgi:hypothetical protein
LKALLLRPAFRKLGVVALTVGMALGCSSCLKTSGHPKLANANHIDAPDPAMVGTGGTTAQIYTTQADNGGYKNVPMWNWNYASNSQGPGGYNDALATSTFYPANASSWATNARVRGPAVRQMTAAGPYVLAWSGSPKNGHQNCLGLATSLAAGGPFAPVTTGDFRSGWCPVSPDVALMDPYLFTGSGGKNWLYFSRQDLSGPRTASTGDLYVVELSSTGMSRVGSPILLASYGAVDAALTGCTATDSSKNPRLENPAMVQDPAKSKFNFFASFGSSQSSCYRTVEMTCARADGGCVPADAQVLPLAGVSALKGTGGASFMKNVSPDGNRVIFAGFGGGFTVRQAYTDSTTCSRSDGSDC